MVTDADRKRARSSTVATHGARSFWERWCVAPDMARRTVVTSGARGAPTRRWRILPMASPTSVGVFFFPASLRTRRSSVSFPKYERRVPSAQRVRPLKAEKTRL